MKTKHSLIATTLIAISFIVSIYSAHAISGTDSIADFDAVKTHINNIQTFDDSLPSGVVEPKGRFGALISRMFTANGKIGNRFLKALGLRSNNNILKWSGGYDGELVNSSITDDGTTVGMSGNLRVSGKIATSTPTANNHAATKAYVDTAVSGAGGLWSENGNKVYYNGGNIGIGINNPNAKLEVKGKISTDNYLEITPWNGTTATYGVGSGHMWYRGTGGTSIAGENMIHIDGTTGLSVAGNVGIGTTAPSNKLHVSGNIGATGWIGAGCEGACDSGGGYALMYGDGHTVIRPSYAGYALNAKTSSASHGGVIGFSQNGTVYGSLGHANSYGVYGYSNSGNGVYGQSTSNYGVYGRTTKPTSGGVLGYNHNASAYGILGFGAGYAFYGSGKGYFSGSVGIGSVALDEKLYVNGNIKIAALKNYIARYNNGNSYMGRFGWSTLQLGNNGANKIIAGNTNAGGSLDFYVNNSNEILNHTTTPNGILTMRMKNNGYVGIGVSNPSEKLDIAGNLKTSGIVKANGGVTVDDRLAITSTNYSHRAQSTAEDHYGYFAMFDNSGDRGAFLGYGNGESRVDLYLDQADEFHIYGGNLNVPGKIITSTPTAGNHVATKSYVDSNGGAQVNPSSSSCYTKLVDYRHTMVTCNANAVMVGIMPRGLSTGAKNWHATIKCCPLY